MNPIYYCGLSIILWFCMLWFCLNLYLQLRYLLKLTNALTPTPRKQKRSSLLFLVRFLSFAAESDISLIYQ
jgi:hypothetical protein